MNVFSKTIYTALVCSLSSTHLLAQQKHSTLDPSNIQLSENRRLWQNTGNAAGLGLDTILYYSSLNIDHHAFRGDFKRPQQPRSGNDQTISTRGNLKLGKIYIEGGFQYKRENLNQVGFNASIIDPYRGMPFIVADTNNSDWRNQHYTLDFALASPKYFNSWTFGLEGRYNASSGAKQRDIRTENYYYSLYLSPSLMYHHGSHHIGTSLIYQDSKEEATQSLVNVYVNQQYYSLLGLGHAVSALGGNGLSNYLNNSRGLGIHYEYSGSIRVKLSGSYKWEAEDVSSSYSNPMPVGTVSRRVLTANASLLKENDRQLHRIDANFLKRKMHGIEYVVKRVNQENENYWDILSRDVRSVYNTTATELHYTFHNKTAIGYNWRLNGGLKYEKNEDVYNIPGSFKNSENLLYQLGATRRITLSPNLLKNLSIGINSTYRSNIGAEYDYKGNFPEYPIVGQLEENDLKWLKTNALNLNVPVRYSQQVKEDNQTNLYLQVEGNLIKPTGNTFKERSAYRVTLGVNF